MVENIKISEKAGKLRHTRIVIDASVLMKVVIQEEDSQLVDEIIALNHSMQLSLFAPPLILFEFLNAISKNFKNREKTTEALKKIYWAKISIIDPKFGYLERGIQSACETSASYYDSSYHALAKEMKGIFLTADTKYYNVMKNEGNIMLLSDLAK